jgi:hypothetical protein
MFTYQDPIAWEEAQKADVIAGRIKNQGLGG